MKKKNISLTIGIPAYNEDENIAPLLKSLLTQKTERLVIESIIVVSDGSTDNTVSVAREIRDSRITIIPFRKRKGIAAAQNELVKRAKSDVCILLDADVLPKDKNFLQEIIKPLANHEVGLVGADIVCISSKGFFEQVISFSHKFKQGLFRRIKNGNNVYLCHGRARALSKSLYKKIRWTDNYAEDAFSYFFCISKGFKFKYYPGAKVLFRSPTNILDHAIQSFRFTHGKKLLESHFPVHFLRYEYCIPIPTLFLMIISYCIKNPIYLITYLFINLYIRNFMKGSNSLETFPQIAFSTKKLQ